jgi:hypothetical protein
MIKSNVKSYIQWSKTGPTRNKSLPKNIMGKRGKRRMLDTKAFPRIWWIREAKEETNPNLSI